MKLLVGLVVLSLVNFIGCQDSNVTDAPTIQNECPMKNECTGEDPVCCSFMRSISIDNETTTNATGSVCGEGGCSFCDILFNGLENSEFISYSDTQCSGADRTDKKISMLVASFVVAAAAAWIH